MRKILTIAGAIILFINTLKAQSQLHNVVVLDENSSIQIESAAIGSINFKDKGFKIKCSYEEGIRFLKKEAIKQNANLIKITEHKKPDLWSSCHRFEADIYYVADPGKYEKEIEWSSERKLIFSDFRANNQPANSISLNSAAVSYCGISFQSSSVNALSKAKFFVHTTFFKEKSWVIDDTSLQTPELLNHEQKHFDLCEVYARKLYKSLNGGNFNAYNLDNAYDIYNSVQEEYISMQEKYDSETNHGTIADEQKRWNEWISDQLLELEKYADHF